MTSELQSTRDLSQLRWTVGTDVHESTAFIYSEALHDQRRTPAITGNVKGAQYLLGSDVPSICSTWDIFIRYVQNTTSMIQCKGI